MKAILAVLEETVPYFSQARFMINSVPKSDFKTLMIIGSAALTFLWFYF